MQNPRKTPRADWIDYDNGMFFVTVCTKNQINYFGEVVQGIMQMSPIGEILKKELDSAGLHHPNIEIPLYVVMPNHFHALIYCDCEDMAGNTADQRNPNPYYRANPDMARHVPTLSRYIASLKSAVSRQAHDIEPMFAWQPRYHDHKIRRSEDLNNISRYIENNPANWHKDCFYTP